MKHRLTTTIEAVALVGCGESQSKKNLIHVTALPVSRKSIADSNRLF